MKRTFYYKERDRQVKLFKERFFGDAQNGGHWTLFDEVGNKTGVATNLDFILCPRDSTINLYSKIRQVSQKYFCCHDISWWRQEEDGYCPSGHLVSSQIHCLNHLFAFRTDEKAVKLMIKKITGIQFDEVLPSFIDNDEHSFISFEFALDNDKLLGENDEGWRRGTLCTSIDVLIVARKGEDKWLIPIEWKYTETYEKKDKTCQKRLDRYEELIKKSDRLKMPQNGEISHSIYFQEPSYELMRQTLLCEQLIRKDYANDFFHINVIPTKHTELRKAVETEFMPMLTKEAKSKFKIIDPQDLLSPLKGNDDYKELLNYLETRYWK